MNSGRQSKAEQKIKNRSRTMGVKIYGMVLFLILVSLCSIFLLAEMLTNLSKMNSEIINHQVKDIELISNIGRDFFYLNGQVMNHVLTTNDSTMDYIQENIKTEIAVLYEKIEEIDERIKTEDPRKVHLDSLKKDLNKYTGTVEYLLKISKSNKVQAASAATSSLNLYAENSKKFIHEMIVKTDEELQRGKEIAAGYEEWIPLMQGGICLLLLTSAFVIVIIIQMTVIRPLKRLTGELQRIMDGIEYKEGDLTVRVQVNSKDEVGQLAKGLNSFLEMLQSIISSIMASCGNLSQQQNIVEENVKSVRQKADVTSSTLVQLGTGMETISSNVNAVNKNTKQAEETVREIYMQAEQGSNYVAEIKHKAEAIEKEARKNKEEVRNMMESIDCTVNVSINESKGVERIGSLTNEILGIAAKTNLLALNASIEAARAGFAGRGFGVVAEEIRLLADSSKQTASSIQRISKEVMGAVGTLADNAEKLLSFVNMRILKDYDILVDAGHEYAKSASNMDSIMNHFKDSTDRLSVVMKYVSNTNAGIDATIQESVEEVTNIGENTVELAVNMREIYATVEGVNQVVGELMNNVNCFQKY